MHIWPFWSNTSRKWVRPACGISGWEWNKLGQTALALVLLAQEDWPGVSTLSFSHPQLLERAPWAQHGTAGMHKAVPGQGDAQAAALPWKCPGRTAGLSLGPAMLISTGSISDRRSLWKDFWDLCTAPPNASVILGFSAAKILQSSLSRERQVTYY